MRTNPIQQSSLNTVNFQAKINFNSIGIKEYIEYLAKCKDAPKGYFSSNKNIELFDKINKAIENHPSNEIIDTEVHYRYGELFNARGIIKTSRAKITDIEPSRSDDGIKPMENLFRKFLNPDNKIVFNKLLGEQYTPIYNNWWDENIKPIWEDIKKTYRCERLEGNIDENDYSLLFNAIAILPNSYVNKLKSFLKIDKS